MQPLLFQRAALLRNWLAQTVEESSEWVSHFFLSCLLYQLFIYLLIVLIVSLFGTQVDLLKDVLSKWTDCFFVLYLFFFVDIFGLCFACLEVVPFIDTGASTGTRHGC